MVAAVEDMEEVAVDPLVVEEDMVAVDPLVVAEDMEEVAVE